MEKTLIIRASNQVQKYVTLQSSNLVEDWNAFLNEALAEFSLPQHVFATHSFAFNLVISHSNIDLLANPELNAEKTLALEKSFLVNYKGSLNTRWIIFAFEQACLLAFKITPRQRNVPHGFSLSEVCFLSPKEASELGISNPNCFTLTPFDRQKLCAHRLERLKLTLVGLLDDFKTNRDKAVRNILNSKSTPEQFEQAISTGFGRGQYTYSNLLSSKRDYFHFIFRNYKAYRAISPQTRVKIRERIGITSDDEMTFLSTVFPNEKIVKIVRILLNTTIKLKPNWHKYLSVENITKSHIGYKLHFTESMQYGHEREVEHHIVDRDVCAGIRVLMNTGAQLRGDEDNLLTHLTRKGVIHDGDTNHLSKDISVIFKTLAVDLFGSSNALREMVASNSGVVCSSELDTNNAVELHKQTRKVVRLDIKIKGRTFGFDGLDFATTFLLDVESHLNSKDIELETIKFQIKPLRRWLSYSKDNGYEKAFISFNRKSLESSIVNFRQEVEAAPLTHASKVAYFNPLIRLLKEMIAIGKFPNILIPKGIPQPRDNTPKSTYLTLSMDFLEGEKDYLVNEYSAPPNLLYTQISTSPELVHGALQYRVNQLKKYSAKLICEFQKRREKALEFANNADINADELCIRFDRGEHLTSLFPASIIGQRRIYLFFSLGDERVFRSRKAFNSNATIQRVFKQPHGYYREVYKELWPGQDVIGACILLFLLETGANPTHVRDIKVDDAIEDTDNPNLKQQRWLKNRGAKDEKLADLVKPKNPLFSENNPSALLCLQWLRDLQITGNHKYLFFCRSATMQESRGPRYLSDSALGTYATKIGLGLDAVNGRIIRNTFLNLKALTDNLSVAQRAAGHSSDSTTFKYMSKEYWQVTADLSIKDFLENLQVLVLEKSNAELRNTLKDYDIRLEAIHQSGLGIFCKDITDSPYQPTGSDSVCGSLDKCMTCENRSPVFIATKQNIASILAFKDHLEAEKERLMSQNSGRWLSTWAYYEAYADIIIERVEGSPRYSKILDDARVDKVNYVFPRLW